jgi:hypothetical protein
MLPFRYAPSITRSLVAGAALIACSPNSGEAEGEAPLTAGAGAASGAGASNGNGAAGSGTAGNAGFVGFRTTDAGKKYSGPDGSCAATHAAAERVVTQKTVEIPVTVTKADPVALYLMQDRSGSMEDTPNGASTDKWTQTTTAVNAFVNSPGSNGLDVALGMFPLDNGTCAGVAYDTPLVGMKRLLDPAQSQAIANALNSHTPGGGGGFLGGIFGNPGNSGTPIEGALRGAENFCLQYEAASPTGERCVVVLITDGAPSGCAGDTATLAGIAADGYAKAGLRTFAIGMDGADFGLMDAIAIAGHSDCTPNVPGQEACNVTGGVTSFNDALALIRNTVTTTTTTTEIQTVVQGTALPCDFTIPSPPNGERFDREKVNVQFFNGTTTDILQVPSVGECANFADVGWYYDDPTTPTKIQLCPATCNQVKAASASADGGVVTLDASVAAPRVDILLGCTTQTVFH